MRGPQESYRTSLIFKLHPSHCEILYLLGCQPGLEKLLTFCINELIRSGSSVPEMGKYNSGNLTPVIVSQRRGSLKEESFLITEVFHLPLLSQCFISWTVQSYGQFTPSQVPCPFAYTIPITQTFLGGRTILLLWPAYHPLVLELYSENEKQCSLLKRF